MPLHPKLALSPGASVVRMSTGERGTVLAEWGTFETCATCYAPVGRHGARPCGHDESAIVQVIGEGTYDVLIGGEVVCLNREWLV
jgi:hypothetical protein